MNDEAARQGRPDKRSSDGDDTSTGGDVKIPFVALVITLEADPKIIVSAESEADREALHVWVREVRPDVDELLHSIAVEIHERGQAA